MLTLRFLAIVFLVVGYNCSFAVEPINCESAPPQTATKLPPPASDLAAVFCSPSGHALVAVDGYAWLAANNRLYFLHSASPSGPVAGESQHSAFFTNASSRSLDGQALQRSKEMFKVEFGWQPPDDVSVTQLDLLSNKGFRYNVFFFVVSGRLDRVIGCIDQCKTSVGMKQVSLSSLK